MAVGVAVAVVSLASYVTVRTQSMRTLDESLRERATQAAQGPVLAQLSSQSLPASLFGAADVRIIFVNANTMKARSADRTTDMKVGAAEFKVASRQKASSARTLIADGERFRMVAVPTDQPGQALVLAQSMRPEDRMLERLGLVALLFGLAGVISAGLAGWGVARNGLRPVRRLITAAEDIARTGQLDPIPIEGNDEIARLATAFNAMLASLAASRDRQRQLVADASHELRTPLTSLRTNIELLAQAGGSARLTSESRNDLLTDVKAQVSEMTTLIGDLVELARDDQSSVQLEELDLAEVVQQSVTRVRRRAPFVEFQVSTDPWPVIGESAALERAITNLLDNAAKWSPEGGVVTARLAQGVFRVEDQGPGISEEDLPHVFERFYRSPESRAMPGSGLGLSIVANVANRHHGSVRATRAASGGAAFEFSIPASAHANP